MGNKPNAVVTDIFSFGRHVKCLTHSCRSCVESKLDQLYTKIIMDNTDLYGNVKNEYCCTIKYLITFQFQDCHKKEISVTCDMSYNGKYCLVGLQSSCLYLNFNLIPVHNRSNIPKMNVLLFYKNNSKH